MSKHRHLAQYQLFFLEFYLFYSRGLQQGKIPPIIFVK